MRIFNLKLAPLLLPFIFHLDCDSQPIQFNSDSLGVIDSYFNQIITNKKLGGAITLIAKGNEIKHLKSYGYLDIEDSIQMNTDLLIPIASMTKIFTTIAILQLQEKGKLQIDDPIDKYIPQFKKTKVLAHADSSRIESLDVKPTIRDFLRHTSGMVYSGGNSHVDDLYKKAGFRTWNKSLAEYVNKAASMPLAFQANTDWKYSYSHDILGYLVEKISGSSLDIYCMNNIIEPLGLTNTGFVVPKSKSDKLSNLYLYKSNNLIIDDNRDSSIYHTTPEAISGGGGWWSSHGGIITSIEDFYLITKLLLNYGTINGINIVNEKNAKSIVSNQIGKLNAYGNKYGLGVGVVLAKNTTKVTEEIYWFGAPYNTYFWINYTNQVIGILFTNTAPFGHLGMMEKFKAMTDAAIIK